MYEYCALNVAKTIPRACQEPNAGSDAAARAITEGTIGVDGAPIDGPVWVNCVGIFDPIHSSKSYLA